MDTQRILYYKIVIFSGIIKNNGLFFLRIMDFLKLFSLYIHTEIFRHEMM